MVKRFDSKVLKPKARSDGMRYWVGVRVGILKHVPMIYKGLDALQSASKHEGDRRVIQTINRSLSNSSILRTTSPVDGCASCLCQDHLGLGD